ncbi:helicase-related protein [Paralimibaculum aggregatum]|nr:helicase-related protein [Limibaculum sp. NKW23]
MGAPIPEAERSVIAVLGPTNTGKTHYAIERMLARADGVIGLPLRLLAREVYDKVVGLRGPGAVALITGEEKILPKTARYFICTVEAMPLDRMVDFVAIDEVQMCADPERGHVFTDRLLNARGRFETLFLGSDAARARIANLVPKARFMGRERFSTLTYAGSKKISRLKPRSAVVAFSIDQVYAIAELIRRQRGGAAVVMGALSPRTRNAQVALYQQGDVDYLVATDAIGMGLNLDIDHVAFAGTSKFDGRGVRRLQANELAQIAGRAGRHVRDGTFGITGEAAPLEPEVVDAIENHRFKPIQRLMWRNSRLDFGSVPRLMASLDEAPQSPDLARAREAEDQATLRALWEDGEVRALAGRPDRVRLLWDTCQIPDFRKVAGTEHVALVGRIYRFLLGPSGCIPSDWIAGQVRRIDRPEGDIDALAKRLAYIRTWTYVANRAAWVEDAAEWQATTRAVEDRLSDALHARLTQRFVDRRTSVLMRRLKQKERLVAEVNDKGEVSVEGEYLGRIDGFRFTLDETASPDEIKTLRSASMGALQGELARRADRLYLAPDTAISLTEQGGFVWDENVVGKLVRGDELLAPKIEAFVDDSAEPTVKEKIERRLGHWIQRRITAQFEPLLAMRDDETVAGLARGVAFQMVEAMGVIPRRQIADDIKALAQEERALLRKHGVRFGQHTIFMPALLKPKPTQLRLLLWSLSEGHEEIPAPPPAGHVTVPKVEGMPPGYWDKAGYRLCGARAVRIDMLERLADMIRPLDAKAGFEATPDMLSITGCTLEQFAEIMNGLGFQAERGEREKTARTQSRAGGGAKGAPAADAPASEPEAEAAAEPPAPAAEAPSEAAAETAAEAEAQTETAAPAAAAAIETPASEAEAPAEAATGTPASVAEAPAEAASESSVSEAKAPAEAAAESPAPEAEAPAEAVTESATPESEAQAEAATETAVSGVEAPAEAAAETPAPEAAASTEPAAETAAAGSEAPAEAAAETPAPEAEATEPEAASAVATTESASGEVAPAAEKEVFFTFTLRPRRAPGGGGKRRRGPQGAEGEAGQEARPEGQRRGPRGGQQQRGSGGGNGGGRDRSRPAAQGAEAGPGNRERQGGPGGKGKGKPPREQEGGGRQQGRGQGKPRDDKPVDPDSPFAILQQLKNR